MPATGHALSMLRSPDAIANILVAGPVYDRARQITSFFKDASQTVFLPVTWPEELPITEVMELVTGVAQTGVSLGPILLNGVVRSPLPSVTDSVWSQIRANPSLLEHQKWLDYLQVWANRVQRERTRLLQSLHRLFPGETPIFDLPFLSRVPASSTLGTELAAAFSG